MSVDSALEDTPSNFLNMFVMQLVATRLRLRLLLFASAFFSTFFLYAGAMPSYLAEIPNGRSVPREDDPEVPCSAIGHMGCAGGAPLNAFGLDFEKSGYSWTKELCGSDSDGDGLSNGEELGDPCCAWSKGNNHALQFSEIGLLSHPGYGSSTLSDVQLESIRGIDCLKSQEGETTAVVDTFYAPGELRSTSRIDYTTDIPVKATTYLRYTYNLPEEPAVNYLVGIESIIGNTHHKHHYVVTACRKPFPPEFDGVLTEECLTNDCGRGYRQLQYEFNCIDIFYLWAPGQDHYAFPENTAFPLGPGAGYPSVYVQIHYDNRNLLKEQTDSSGIIWHWTPNKREHDVGFLSLGPALLHHQEIPPGKQSYYFSGRCSLDVNMELAPDGLTLTSYFPHMHSRGRRMWTEILGEAAADNSRIPSKFAEVGKKPLGTMGSIDNFDSELNLGYRLKADERERKVKKGDLLATTCIFNTEGLDEPVRGGFGTFEEMCINFVMFYPAQAVPLKSCFIDYFDYGAPFHGEWPAELSQNASSALELPELAEALLAPKQEFGPWGYPTNDPRAMLLLAGGNGNDSGPSSDAIPDEIEDIVLHGPASEKDVASVAAALQEGTYSGDASFAKSVFSSSLITFAIAVSSAIFVVISTTYSSLY